MILKKTSIPSEKENIVNQMQMIRVGEGAFGVGQTERAITPSSEARHLSCLFRFRPPVRARPKKNSRSLCALEVKCANQLPTIDQHRITDAFQFSCLIIICFRLFDENKDLL